MNDSTAIEAATALLFGYAERRQARLKRRGLQLAHYTSADVGASILLKQDVWMRNASSMNDYMEVAFGASCLKTALKRHGLRFQEVLDNVRSGLCLESLGWLERSDYNHHQHTYLTSLSEHRPDDDLGLLSMWRAYGGPVAGVALIFSPTFMKIDGNQLSTWSSPVLYGEEPFICEFERLVTSLENNIPILIAAGPDVVRSLVFNTLQFAILSAKHVGFREEREWRIIHCPREFASAWVQPTFESVRGKPEVVYHLPLRNNAGMSLPALDVKSLLHRIIIGPCQNPYQVASTFEDILRSLGFDNPDTYIKLSHIPLRQSG